MGYGKFGGKKPPSSKIAIAAAAILAIAVLLLCIVLPATYGSEEQVKLRYDGRTYLEKGNGGTSGQSPYNEGSGGGLFSQLSKGEESTLPELDGSDAVSNDAGGLESAGGSVGAPADVPGDGGILIPRHGKKLVYSYEYEVESERYDDLVAAMERTLSDMGGYVESSSVDRKDFEPIDDGDRVRSVRKGVYVLKVPAEKAAELRDLLGGDLSAIVREDVSMEDRTEAYADAQAQMESYQAEYDTLQRLLLQATSVSDLIEIQDRLSYLNYQIQYAKKDMEIIDTDVALSRVDLVVYEVQYYTATVPRYVFDFGERMAEASRVFLYGLPDFIFTLVYVAMAGLVVMGLCAILFRIQVGIRNRKAKDQVVRIVDDRQPAPTGVTGNGKNQN